MDATNLFATRRPRTWPWLFLFAWLLCGDSAKAGGISPGFFPVHGSEPFLLHHRINPALFSALQIWDTRLANWRAMQPAEVPGERTPLLLVHIWADWCVPCREEFPVLREVMADFDKLYGPRVKVVLLSETSGPENMRAFLAKYRLALPRAPHYLDSGEGLASALKADLPMPLPYPVTLVLDDQRVIRHAIVGSVTNRRGELRAAITQLLGLPRPALLPPLR